MRCTQAQKMGVGSVHLHRRWWAPWLVASMWFQPLGRSVMYRIPEEQWSAVMAVGSFEQAMALLRSAGSVETRSAGC